jgi:hypothetical protein
MYLTLSAPPGTLKLMVGVGEPGVQPERNKHQGSFHRPQLMWPTGSVR